MSTARSYLDCWLEQQNSDINHIPVRGKFFFLHFSSATIPQSSPQRAIARIISAGLGEKIKTKPRPFTRAAKLETQNGIRKSRKVCQPPRVTRSLELAAVVLMYRA